MVGVSLFGWCTLCLRLAYLVFWLPYSFDWNVVFVVLIGVLGVSIGVFLYWDDVLGAKGIWDGVFVT